MLRPRLTSDGVPSRYDPASMSAAELAIAAAVDATEKLSVEEHSDALSDAVSFLKRAQHLVAGHLEGETYPIRAQRKDPNDPGLNAKDLAARAMRGRPT